MKNNPDINESIEPNETDKVQTVSILFHID